MTFSYSSLRGSQASTLQHYPDNLPAFPPSGPVAASAEGSFGAERTTGRVAIGAV